MQPPAFGAAGLWRMVSGRDDRRHRLWTRPGQTLRGRVDHRTSEPLRKYSQDFLPHRIAESCLAVNIIVIIMKLWNCRFSAIKQWGRQLAGTTDDHVIA